MDRKPGGRPMNKPHIKISTYGNVPVWRVVWPQLYWRASRQAYAAIAFVRAKNRERMPDGFGRAWRAANPGVCDCMMPWPDSPRRCTQLAGPHASRYPRASHGKVRT